MMDSYGRQFDSGDGIFTSSSRSPFSPGSRKRNIDMTSDDPHDSAESSDYSVTARRIRGTSNKSIRTVPPRNKPSCPSQGNQGLPGGSVIKKMTGTLPPYNDNSTWVDDPTNNRVYMYGGIRPDDDSNQPSADFFFYDTQSMHWQDLTHSMKFRTPQDPYSSIELDKPTKPLPRLGQPGSTLWRCGNTSLIVMFGGYDLEADKPSARVIIINPNTAEWWYEEHLDAGGPTPCISPSLVSVENQIFIFGGYQSYCVDPKPCRSYSVFKWEPPSATSRSRWCWQSCNKPYTSPMPEETIIGQAVSVYNGKFILLAPGKTNEHDKDNKYLRFTSQNVFYFRPSDETFRPLSLQGEAPKDIGWYAIYDLQSTMTTAAGIAPPFTNMNTPATAISIPKPRGRPPKNRPTPLSQASLPPSQPRTSLFPPIPSVAVCAWIAQRETPHGYIDLERTDPVVVKYKPEIWRISFGPVDECENLNYMQKVFQLNADFQGFTVANGRMLLLGSDQKTKSSLPESERLDTWNIYLDLAIIS